MHENTIYRYSHVTHYVRRIQELSKKQKKKKKLLFINVFNMILTKNKTKTTERKAVQ